MRLCAKSAHREGDAQYFMEPHLESKASPLALFSECGFMKYGNATYVACPFGTLTVEYAEPQIRFKDLPAFDISP